MKNRVILFCLLCVGITILTSGCTANSNPLIKTPDPTYHDVAGFWMGLWHGVICIITFIGSLFSERVHVYEVHNVGCWYDFGFLLGIVISFIIVSTAAED